MKLFVYILIGAVFIVIGCKKDELIVDFEVSIKGKTPEAIISITNKTVNAKEYLWVFDEGASITSSNQENPPLVIVSKSGKFKIWLVADDGENSKEIYRVVDIDAEDIKYSEYNDNTLLSIPEENIMYSYPQPNQYNYYQDEYDTNFIQLNRSLPYLLNEIEGETLGIQFKQVGGEIDTLLPLKYDNHHALITYKLPLNLDNNAVYKTQIVKIDDVADSIIDTLYTTHFRTSLYNTFRKKMNALSYSSAGRWELYPKVHRLSVSIEGERFDYYEATGRYENSMIECEMLYDQSVWYQDIVKNFIAWDNEILDELGADKFQLSDDNTYLIQNGGARKLTDEEIRTGICTDVNTYTFLNSFFVQDIAEYISYLRNIVVNTEYVNDSRFQSLIYDNIGSIDEGDYPTDIKYYIPGKTLPNSVFRHNVKVVYH